jgi:hypothetical protein
MRAGVRPDVVAQAFGNLQAPVAQAPFVFLPNVSSKHGTD